VAKFFVCKQKPTPNNTKKGRERKREKTVQSSYWLRLTCCDGGTTTTTTKRKRTRPAATFETLHAGGTEWPSEHHQHLWPEGVGHQHAAVVGDLESRASQKPQQPERPKNGLSACLLLYREMPSLLLTRDGTGLHAVQRDGHSCVPFCAPT